MPHRRNSIVGALILIVIGALFLYSNMHPGFDPWPLAARYWPLLLVFIGIGKLWDYYRYRSNPEAAGRRWFTGGEIAFIILLIIFFGFLSFGSVGKRQNLAWSQSIDRGTAQSVNVNINMPAGDLNIDGDGTKLLDADFDYDSSILKPEITYNLEGSQGELRVNQPDQPTHIHIGPTRNTWHLHLGKDVPMDMRVNMGAGRDNLHLSGLQVAHVDVNMGAGLLIADLTGNWKQDLDANFHGGAGNATIRLPRSVGVVVHAKGGLGTIQADGLVKEGDTYVNDQYGKSPVTLRVNVEGGVGIIRLESVS